MRRRIARVCERHTQAASGEFASLSAERDDDASSEGFLVAAFEVTTRSSRARDARENAGVCCSTDARSARSFKDQAAWALFEEREEEFDLVQVPFEDLQSGTQLGHGLTYSRLASRPRIRLTNPRERNDSSRDLERARRPRSLRALSLERERGMIRATL